MSSQQKFAELVDRLFSRFIAIYGSQKVAGMWGDADIAEVKQVWTQRLSQFQIASIGGAVDRLIESGREWPPTLPEFVELCRQAAIGRANADQSALLPMPRSTPEAAGQFVAQVVKSIKSRGPNRAWAGKILARHQAGESVPMAVLAMARAAQNETPAL